MRAPADGAVSRDSASVQSILHKQKMAEEEGFEPSKGY